MRRITVAAVVVAVLHTAPSLAQSSLYPYDGEWSGEMQTIFSSAPCGMHYRLEMSVAQGAATGSATRSGERFTLYGTIDADGKLTWTMTSGRGSATADGLVKGDTARGDWAEDEGRCAGNFSMDKKP